MTVTSVLIELESQNAVNWKTYTAKLLCILLFGTIRNVESSKH